MPCRVGITTDTETRKAAWQVRVVGMKNWTILGTFSSREDAQELETRYASNHGCNSSPGGATTEGPWQVYHFEYTRTR